MTAIPTTHTKPFLFIPGFQQTQKKDDKRFVERIFINDPTIDAKIQKEESLAKRQSFKNTTIQVAAISTMIALTALAAIGVPLLAFTSPILCTALVGVVYPFAISALAIGMFLLNKRNDGHFHQTQANALKAVKTPEFRGYLQTTFESQLFSVNNLTEAHHLFNQRAFMRDQFQKIRDQERALKARLV
ncbi:MAG: hypothetical protein FJZ64_01420 [Chlamydiae bacterium]|nr:hypothetical protein [Chlamydiota bacterium]